MRIKDVTLLIVFFLLILPSSTQALNTEINTVDVKFDIKNDRSVHHTITYEFETPFSGVTNYSVKGEVKNVKTYTPVGEKKVDSSLEKRGGDYVIEINSTSDINSLTIEYVKESAVFKSERTNFFFTELAFAQEINGFSSNIIVPKGYTASQDSIRPEGSKITSDGKRIIIKWEERNVTGRNTFAVKYEKSTSQTAIWVLISIVLAIALFFSYFYYKKKAREEFLRGFTEAERKVITYLEDNKEVMQKDIQKEFRLSRSKTTRVVKTLEEKGLVEKESHGRTNRIYWVK